MGSDEMFDLETYLTQLDEQLQQGDLDAEDYKNILSALQQSPSGKNYEQAINSRINQYNSTESFQIRHYIEYTDEIKLRGFQDLYFRELFGRPKTTDDRANDLSGVQRFVIETPRTMIGLCEYYAFEGESSFAHTLYLDTMILSHEYRKLGLGRHMLLYAAHLAMRHPDIDRIALYATDKVCDFYAKHGFFNDYTINYKEGVQLRFFQLPLTLRSYRDIRDEIEDIDDPVIIRHRGFIDDLCSNPKQLNDLCKHPKKNPFLALLYAHSKSTQASVTYAF